MNFDVLKQIFRQYFTFSRSERNGITFLCVLLFGLIILDYSLVFVIKPSPSDFSDVEKAITEWETHNNLEDASTPGALFIFDPNTITKQKLDSLAIPSRIKSNIINYRTKGGRFYNVNSLKRIYGMNDSIFSLIENYIQIEKLKKDAKPAFKINNKKPPPKYSEFDPNLVTEAELLVMGFNKYQIANILKYRKNGGVFKVNIDFLKIYGIDASFYRKIEGWIKIKNSSDSILVIEEHKIPNLIELNGADSLTLTKLNGIGPVFASRITRYRDLLGGFNNVSQLLEVYNLKTETLNSIKNYISVDSVKIRKLSLNFSDYHDFFEHPYLLHKDAKNIIGFRNKNGSFETCEDLISKNILGRETYLRIKPYIKLN